MYHLALHEPIIIRVGVIHLATGGLLSEFSQSLLGWLTHQAADQEYLPLIPTVHFEGPLVLESLCAKM